MELDLAGKRAVVAAATQGLGFGCAQALVAEGASVVICGRTEERVAGAVDALGPNAHGVVADLSHPEGARGFVVDAMEYLDGIDILVTNTGGPTPGRADTMPLEAYAEAFESLCLGAIAMCDTALPVLRRQRWGRIVAITSIAVRQPIPTLALSNTARTALTAYLKSLAGEVATEGITVNSVQPGLHLTDRVRSLHDGDFAAAAAAQPTGHLGDPGDFGAVVAFLCSAHAQFITGAAIPVDGGSYGGLQ